LIRLIITDLDNTIYNWVDYFVPCFNAMVNALSQLTGIPKPRLKESFRDVYRRHGTTEFREAIRELDVLGKSASHLSSREIERRFSSAIESFRDMRRKTLRLYPSVRPTLQRLRDDGYILVAHTDARAGTALHRMGLLGIINLFSGLVATHDPLYKVKCRRRHPPYIRVLPDSQAKPHPAGVRAALKYFRVSPPEALYIGDSIRRDLVMARTCGVWDIYAKYGREYDPDHYRQLIAISHWDDASVRHELGQNFQFADGKQPSFTISKFSEIRRVIRNIDRSQPKELSPRPLRLPTAH